MWTKTVHVRLTTDRVLSALTKCRIRCTRNNASRTDEIIVKLASLNTRGRVTTNVAKVRRSPQTRTPEYVRGGNYVVPETRSSHSTLVTTRITNWTRPGSVSHYRSKMSREKRETNRLTGHRDGWPATVAYSLLIAYGHSLSPVHRLRTVKRKQL